MNSVVPASYEIPPDHPMQPFEPLFEQVRASQVLLVGGAVMHCSLQPKNVIVTRPDMQTYFSTSIETDAFGYTVMRTNVRTKDQHGIRDPGLYAGTLMQRSIAYFDRHNDQPVTTFAAHWKKTDSPKAYSTNYRQYMVNLGFKQAPTSSEQGTAAQATWTGQQLKAAGFDRIIDITETPDHISVLFQRSSALRGIHERYSALRARRYASDSPSRITS